MRHAILLALLFLCGCAAPRPVPALASARVVADFASYRLERIGLLPPVGVRLTEAQTADIQAACLAEFSATTRMEVVRLEPADLEAVPHPALDAIAGAINPQARCHAVADPGEARFAWDVIIDPNAEPQAEPVELKLARISRGAEFELMKRRPVRS